MQTIVREQLQAFDDTVTYLVEDRGVRLSPEQKRYLHMVRAGLVASMAPDQLAELRKLPDMTSVSDDIECRYPVHSGLMYVQTLAAVAVAVSQPGKRNVICLMPTGRVCQMWLRQASHFIDLLGDRVKVVQRDSREFITLCNTDTGVKSTITAIPTGTVSGRLRGQGEHLAILFVNQHTLDRDEAHTTIVPLLASGATLFRTFYLTQLAA